MMISKPRMTKYCKRRVLTMQELASGLTERKTRSVMSFNNAANNKGALERDRLERERQDLYKRLTTEVIRYREVYQDLLWEQQANKMSDNSAISPIYTTRGSTRSLNGSSVDSSISFLGVQRGEKRGKIRQLESSCVTLPKL